VLAREDVAYIVARYVADRVTYELVTAELHRRVLNLVNNHALKSVITSRAKSADSLQRTLWNDRADWTPDELRSLSPSLSDLAGVRILLYRDEDVTPAVEAIRREFPILREKDKRSRDGYSAYHLVVHEWCTTDDPNHAMVRHVPCEIQICTVVEHVWNELEHDIRYKQPGGAPDDRQIELLDSLRAELDLSAQTAARLMRRTADRIRENSEPFGGPHDLRRYLEARFRQRVDGAFDDLLSFLGRLLIQITPRELDDLFDRGQSKEVSESTRARFDVDGAHGEVGLACVMILPALHRDDVREAVGEQPSKPLWKFLLRVVSEHDRGRP
jgi:ppGpp synthetase/RelA/SpoT-type nucleotidyltranferase